MKFAKSIAFFTGLFCITVLSAQHHHKDESLDQESAHQHHGKHKVAFFAGFTHVDAAFYRHETHQEKHWQMGSYFRG